MAKATTVMVSAFRFLVHCRDISTILARSVQNNALRHLSFGSKR